MHSRSGFSACTATARGAWLPSRDPPPCIRTHLHGAQPLKELAVQQRDDTRGSLVTHHRKRLSRACVEAEQKCDPMSHVLTPTG